jgi:hypothetical protein
MPASCNTVTAYHRAGLIGKLLGKLTFGPSRRHDTAAPHPRGGSRSGAGCPLQQAQAAFWNRLQDAGSGSCGDAHESGRMTHVAPGLLWRGKVTKKRVSTPDRDIMNLNWSHRLVFSSNIFVSESSTNQSCDEPEFSERRIPNAAYPQS